MQPHFLPKKRGLGEDNIDRIQVVGDSIESFQERFGLC